MISKDDNDSKPRVLVLANNDIGLWNFRRELLEALVSEGYSIACCLPDGERIPDIVGIGTKFIPCNLLNRHGTNPIQDLSLMRFYKRVIRDEKPCVVLTYTIKPNVYGGMACSSLGVPYIANITGLGSAVENGGPLQSLTLSLYKKGLSKARMVFFQNASNQEFMVDRDVIAGPYALLPGSGVNLDRFPPLPYPSDDTIRFTFMARIMEQKGIEQFLDAADYFTARRSDVEFHVYGAIEDGYDGRLRECQEKGTVVYHGQTSDVLAVHKASSCTVHPTYYPEGLSNVLLESCACARPIITTDRHGCREIVDDGVNGYIVEQQSSVDLAAKLKRFLSLSIDDRAAMGMAGRRKVENKFDRKIVIEKYLDEVQHIYGRNK